MFDIIDGCMFLAIGFMYAQLRTQRKAQQSLAIAPDPILLALRVLVIVVLVIVIVYRAITGNRA